MNGAKRLRTCGPMAVRAGRAMTSLSARVRGTHNIGWPHRPIHLRWRRSIRAGFGVHALTRQTIAVAWAPQITLHVSLPSSDRVALAASVVQRAGSPTRQQVAHGWRDLHTTRTWRLCTYETLVRHRASSRAAGVDAARRRAGEFAPTVIASRIGRATTATGYEPLRVPTGLRATQTALTGHIAQRHAGRLHPIGSLSFRKDSATTLHRILSASVSRRSTTRTLSDHTDHQTVYSHSRASIQQIAELERRTFVSRVEERHQQRPGPSDDSHGSQRSVRPIAFTWRRSSPSDSGSTASMPIEASFTSVSSRGRASMTQPTSPRVAVAAQATTQVRPFNLDAGQLDRLTDDVIRRVERRVRIARERRGL
jgi:hypothetical protein